MNGFANKGAAIHSVYHSSVAKNESFEWTPLWPVVPNVEFKVRRLQPHAMPLDGTPYLARGYHAIASCE